MTEFIVAALRIGFLALVWAFILLAGNVIRTDIFGQRVAAAGEAETGRRRGLLRRRTSTSAGAGSAAAAAAASPAQPGAAGQASSAPRRVVVTEGRSQGAEFPLTGVMGIGRASSQAIVIDDDYSSSRHAQLIPAGDGSWAVEDLGSTNGTFVNGTRITQPTRVGVGDVIRIGRTHLGLES